MNTRLRRWLLLFVTSATVAVVLPAVLEVRPSTYSPPLSSPATPTTVPASTSTPTTGPSSTPKPRPPITASGSPATTPTAAPSTTLTPPSSPVVPPAVTIEPISSRCYAVVLHDRPPMVECVRSDEPPPAWYTDFRQRLGF